LSINSKSTIKPIRKKEKWYDIISQSNIGFSKPVNYITATQIKQVSNEEPRLMAKIDRLEDVPKVFKDNGVFILPVSRREYAIIKGKGHHELESIAGKPTVHHTELPFPLSVSGKKTESIYLTYASSCGLLKKLSGADTLIPVSSDKTVTPNFTFDINGIKISVNKAQIQVDQVFESLNEIMLFEAKINVPHSFNIRQLYYPFRTFDVREPGRKKKKVRSFFFCFKPKDNSYLFWEYEFDPYNSFSSIKLIQCKQYQVKVTKALSIKQFAEVSVRKGVDIPQADDIDKIVQFAVKVFEGFDTKDKIRAAFGGLLVARQINYYRQAAEILGLIRKYCDNYEPTDILKDYLNLPAEKKSNFICKLLLQFPLMNEIFIDVSSDKNKVVSKQAVGLLRKKSDLTGDTLFRRARTIVSWFRWLKTNLGIVEVDRNRNIRISRQLSLT
jgi:hypothetical protein